MDITQYYAIFSGALIVLPIIVWAVRCLSGLVYKYQNCLYRYAFTSKRVTRLEAFLISTVLAANAFCIGFDYSAQNLMHRSGLVSSINFAFLTFGYHMNSLYKSSGLLLSDYGRIHYWAAGISIVEALIHSVIAAILKTGKTDMVSRITTWTAFSTIIIVLFSTFAIFTGRYYEAFAVTHQFSAAVILAMVWIHAGRGGWSTAPSVYLIGAAGFFTITRCLWLFRILYRNLRSGKSLSRAKVERDSKIMFMSVTIPRPWNFKAGQYVKLCMPFLSWGSMLQWHPFALLSYEEINGNMIIRLMIKERKGFTAVLARKGNPDREMLALVDGPYGRDIQLRTYGTVLLFATGIGIAGLLLYAHQTLEEYYAQKTSCRRIFLFWEADDSTANKTLIESDLHRLSSHNIFKLQLIETGLDIEKEVYKSIQGVPGNIAILTCVNQQASETARELREDLFKMKVHLFELEFHP